MCRFLSCMLGHRDSMFRKRCRGKGPHPACGRTAHFCAGGRISVADTEAGKSPKTAAVLSKLDRYIRNRTGGICEREQLDASYFSSEEGFNKANPLPTVTLATR